MRVQTAVHVHRAAEKPAGAAREGDRKNADPKDAGALALGRQRLGLGGLNRLDRRHALALSGDCRGHPVGLG
jgi:hypothetical protein